MKNKMKIWLIASLSFLTVACSACWFTAENFNRDYIAGVNNYVAHYDETSDFNDAIYYNGLQVSLPLTVWVKVGPRKNSLGEYMPIVKAVLQYKILPSGNWKTVKTIYNYSSPIQQALPCCLFGKNNIDPQIRAGTEILIRVYLTDGIFETGDLNSDIVSPIPDMATEGSGGEYEGGWTAPFVFRVIYNGKRTKL